MTCTTRLGSPCSTNTGCPDKFGCSPEICPDFTIKRHDMKPPFKVKVEDCDGPMDLVGMILEANMWAKGKLKKNICPDDTIISLADNIGFEQAMVGDIIVFDRVRNPEHMLVVAFDENLSLIEVQRGYHGTQISYWKKGKPLRIFRMMNAPAQTEMVYEDEEQIDGTFITDKLQNSFLIYEWTANDTCLPGCYYLEFKLLKMITPTPPISVTSVVLDDFDDTTIVTTVPTDISEIPYVPSLVSVVPFEDISCTMPSTISFTSISETPSMYGCTAGAGVEWVRRFPSNEGFLIKIIDSPTAELS